MLERLDVELAVLAAELHEVQRREVARRVVDGHVLGARVRRVDAARVRERVPGVDRGVVLHAGIGALPRGFRHLAEEVAGIRRLDDRAVGAGGEVPLLALDDGLHELIRHAHRVVRVLVLDRRPVGRVQRHVVAGLLEDARFPLLLGLAPDELLDVGVLHVEHDHLGRAPRLAARLDRAGGRVGAAHEGDRAGGVAALRELLFRRAQPRQVEAGARAAAEDDALAADPVEDRLHRVVDREDEAGAALRLRLEADVEPDRRVERRVLVDEDRLELGLEGVGLLVRREVAALTAPAADRVDDAADHLLDGALALGRGHAAAEVLLRDDVRRGLRPELRELDVLLLEGRAVAAGDVRVAQLPLDRVERIDARDGEVALRSDARLRVDDRVHDLVGRLLCDLRLLHRCHHFLPDRGRQYVFPPG